jgi:hypothetical protein
VIGGSLGRLGDDFVVTVRLWNVKQATVEARAEQVVHGAVEELRAATKIAARRLFGQSAVETPAPGRRSPLFVTGAVVGGLGGLLALVSGSLAVAAELRLGNDTEVDKAALASEGQTALGVACLGSGIALVGGILVAVDTLAKE